MTDPRSTLTPGELADLRETVEQWRAARIAKEWERADALRADLQAWGAYPPERGWHPVAESPQHRQARLEARV